MDVSSNIFYDVLVGALAALGKGLAVVDARVDLEHLAEIFSDDADED